MSSLKGDSGRSGFKPDPNRNYGVWGDAQAGYGVIGSAGISNTEFGIGVLGSGAVIGVQGLGDKIDVSVGVEGTGTLYGISGIDGSNTGSGTGVHGDSPGGA